MRISGTSRKWFKRIFIATILTFVGFVGGSVFGFTFHASYSFFGYTVPDGYLAVARLSQLEKGNVAVVKMDLESKIDMALAEYSSASEEWWFPIHQDGWSLYEPDDFEMYVRKAACYRKTHPSPYRDVHKEMKDPELAESSRQFQRRVEEMVEKYAEQ